MARPLPHIPPVETHRLSWHELFHISNPNYEIIENEELDSVDDICELDDTSEQDKPKSSNSNESLSIPINQHQPSINAKDPVNCYDYDSSGQISIVKSTPFAWIPDWKLLRDFLAREGRLDIKAALELVKRARMIFQKETNVLYLRPPYTLVGDVHGQYYDMLSMFEMSGDPETTPYLFLGDYVDRGLFGCEIVFLLCALKINFPQTFHMIRGNHECRLLTSHFTFKRETLKKYKSQELYDEIMLLFDALPLAVLMEDSDSRFLCVHGGLSPDIESLSDIECIDRFQEPGKSGPLCDLLWSDPLEEDTASGLSADEMQEWYDVKYVENPTRGCGYVFGYAATMEFLDNNRLTAIIRAHEVQRAGYGLNRFKQPVDTAEPLVITVFSAPNYCDFYANKGAVLKILPAEADESTTNIQFAQFDCVPHPFWLPKLQDGIEYSFPFMLEKISSLLEYLTSEDDLDEETEEEKEFYIKASSMLSDWESKRSDNQSSSDPQPKLLRVPSISLPRLSPRGTLGLPSPSSGSISPRSPRFKEFLTVKDRIGLLNQDVQNKAHVVSRLSECRGGLIDQKIFQSRLQAYLAKATTKFQKAKQSDWLNECLPN